MADRTGDPRFLAEAIAVHSQYVVCRDPQRGQAEREWYAMYPPDMDIGLP